jgi:hypothetical protein
MTSASQQTWRDSKAGGAETDGCVTILELMAVAFVRCGIVNFEAFI